MIQKLNVQNFALIEDILIDFNKGLSVLTGETGAGKSIILESLHLLFGKRADQDMIRFKEEKASVSGVFLIPNLIAKELGIEEKITITREIEKSGKHKITLNDEPITLQKLKQLTSKIGLIHSQNDTMSLLFNSEYLNFVDLVDIDSINKIYYEYLLSRSNYLDEVKHLNRIKNEESSSLEQKEFLEYQLKELKNLNLVENEDLELTEKSEKLTHFDKIFKSLLEVNNILDDESILNNLYLVSKELQKISSFDKDLEKYSDVILDFYYNMTEIKHSLKEKQEDLSFDQNEFDSIQERLYVIKKLEEKYKKALNELISYQEEIEEKLSLSNNYEGYIKKVSERVDNSYKKAFSYAKKLSELRKKQANKLEKDLIEELKDLDLDKAKFNIVFSETNELLEVGIDMVEFMISLNEGEPLKPLSKVASGGERARFMFALKTIYAKQNNLSLLVLDEIDIGISGKTASKVAKKMKELSNIMQLVVISHLPQVAAKADTQYGIRKEKINGRMTTQIEELTFDERVKMIALMLSDEELSEFAINQAKMLLK